MPVQSYLDQLDDLVDFNKFINVFHSLVLCFNEAKKSPVLAA